MGKLPVFNTTSEDVPPFGCMQRRRPKKFKETVAQKKMPQSDVSQYLTQHLRGGKIIWDIFKCDGAGAGRQDPSEFLFNGPITIKSLSYGEGVDIDGGPVQALHGSSEKLKNFRSCGPVEDRWDVKSDGDAFTCISHDISKPTGSDKLHTIWIKRGTPRPKGNVQIYCPHDNENSLDAGDYLPYGSNLSTFHLFGQKQLHKSEDSRALVIDQGGTWFFTFNAMMGSPDAARGDLLIIRPYILRKGKTDPERTYSVGAMKMEVEKDAGVDIKRGASNVAFFGQEDLAEGDQFMFKNEGSNTLTLQYLMMTMRQVVKSNDDTDESGNDTTAGFDIAASDS